jgi:hypothetical protein|tara:strand:+ start:9 stop:485 length:477 start_codon:yes stop_codon:yes gene_type:complete
MNELKITIPEGIKITPELIRRIQLAALPEIAEHHALGICKKYFGKKFKIGKYNSIGFDIISEDGTIIVEVKQTSSVMGISKRLQVTSYKSKKTIMTHILIIDYNSNRGCILEHDDFFNKTQHQANEASWKWDSEYNMKESNRCEKNTKWFLDKEVPLK